MRTSRLALLLAPAALALAAGCASPDEPDAEEVQEELSEALVEAGYDAEQADCLAAAVVEEVGVDNVNDIDFNDEAPDPELQEQIGAAVASAVDECELGA